MSNNQNLPLPHQKEWLNTDELEIEYGFKKETQKKLRKHKRIPYSKVGGYIRYSRTIIDGWLKLHTVEAVG